MLQKPTTASAARPFGRVMMILFWLLAIGLLSYFFGNIEEQQYNPNQNLSHIQTASAREVVLERNRYHHYVASGFINGVPVTFMLDTGASTVAVPAKIAAKIGLTPGARQISNTANGRVEVRATEVAELQLGAITLHNLRASILPTMEGDEILLGMSALKEVEFTQRGNQLTLRQYQ